MAEILEALNLVGRLTLEPHLAGNIIINLAGTEREKDVLAYLKQHQVVLRDYHCRQVITDIIDALETR